MLAIVVDTNTLLRALIRSAGSDWRIYESFVTGNLKWFYSRKMIDEFIGTLAYPRLAKRIDFGKINRFLSPIVNFGALVTAVKTELCRDKDDNEILGVALTAARRKKPVYLITSDKDLLELKTKISGVNILTATEFAASFLPVLKHS